MRVLICSTPTTHPTPPPTYPTPHRHCHHLTYHTTPCPALTSSPETCVIRHAINHSPHSLPPPSNSRSVPLLGEARMEKKEKKKVSAFPLFLSLCVCGWHRKRLSGRRPGVTSGDLRHPPPLPPVPPPHFLLRLLQYVGREIAFCPG